MERTKGWIERAQKTGNWGAHEKKACRQLAKSGAQTRASRKTKQPDRHEAEREDLRARSVPAAAPAEDDLRHEEFVGDGLEEQEDALPSDDEEAALAEPASAAVVTLSAVYDDYLVRGGNRRIPGRALAELGKVPVDEIDRSTIIAATRMLYPRSSQGERAELLIDPMEEILGFARSREPKPCRHAATKQQRLGPLPEYWLLRAAELEAEREEFDAKLGAVFAAAAARKPDPARWYRDSVLTDHRESDWTSAKPIGPPPDPPSKMDTGWRPPKWWELWNYRHRGLGYQIKPAPVGRPRKNKSTEERKRDNAARQQHFRDRRKGKRNGNETS